MIRKRILSFLLVLLCVTSGFPNTLYAEDADSDRQEISTDAMIDLGIEYLAATQDEYGAWGMNPNSDTAAIGNIVEYLDANGHDSNHLLEHVMEYYDRTELCNLDDLSNYLLIDGQQSEGECNNLKSMQNEDGGFGLDKNYASDILDSMLALKALEDLGEAEAMSKAAHYIVSRQNEDGGFGYQTGLQSDPGLTAEIADILADCIRADEYLAETVSDNVSRLEEYLDAHMAAVEELSADNLALAVQQLHTVSFKLKRNGRYDVTPYYKLQGEDGSVYQDPVATALLLELIVREQNAVVSRLDHIFVTNDAGYTVSAFNRDENVNIEIGSEYETEKAELKVVIETPEGERIPIDLDHLVWNTGDSEEGTYAVKAEIVRSSNKEVLVSKTTAFRIEHCLAVDSLSLKLSQSFARIGDETAVDVSAAIDFRNFSEKKDHLLIRWSVKCEDEILKTEEKKLTDEELKETGISLGEFTPDTSERRVYLISAEILSDDLVLAQSTTNFFVSDKSVAVVRNVDKEVLHESEKDAEITVKIRDERVVDLIFTTSSEDTKLISQYADNMEAIKKKLENMGYLVNICSVSTSYLSAQDTFAWNEYDHLDYEDRYVESIPKHILYHENSISMLGYGYEAMKDFLLVPDTNDSQKILEFDLQRDNSNDWHTLDGGGFLFNASAEDNILKGYCVLVNQNGLNLIQIAGVDLNRFRNGSYNTVQSAGKLLKNFRIGNVLDKHHIKVAADGRTLSLWDGDNQLLDHYELPANDYGNGYGPITSYKSHACWVRSSFEFSNITMQTITGEKLADILDNYNFESPTSRYVVNLSDNPIDDLNTEEEVQELAQKITEKDISFIGLGNDKNREQYQKLTDSIGTTGRYYDFGEGTTPDSLSDYIISEEESKRVKIEDDIIATDLVFTGTLYDGTAYEQTFEKLCAGETLEIRIPVEFNGPILGTDAVLLKDITLKYKDENEVSRSKPVTDVTLPVIASAGDIQNQVTTDAPEYTPYQEVSITDRIHNTSKNRTEKGLTNIITVLNEDKEVVAKFSKSLSEIMTCSYIERKELWNTADTPAGEYTIHSEIYDRGVLLSESAAQITITSSALPEVHLNGEIHFSDKILEASDEIEINSMVENVGHTEVVNGKTVIQIISGKDGSVVYQYEEPLNLNLSEQKTGTITVRPETDFSSNKSGDYMVKFEVVLEDGRVIPLAGDGFLYNRGISDIVGENVLFSLDTAGASRGILMNGSIITVNGGVHSNTDMEYNSSILNITDTCDSVFPAVFHTLLTNVNKSTEAAEVMELPDLSGGLGSDVYSDKTVLVELSAFKSDTDAGVLIGSSQDVIIRSADVDFKGVIYAPNGTVIIESSNFNLRGRIIAKNIVYQGSAFYGEAYEGDLDLLN